jgi:phage major head subunit gpT-like protein
MLINQSNLQLLFTGYRANFQNGLSMAEPTWQRVATEVPSTTRDEKYAWLGQVPMIREWIGDRVIQNIAAHDYAIKNRDFELTLEVDRNDIEDDTYGVFAPAVTEMGRATAVHPDQLVYGEALANSFTGLCYDGQPFISAAHPWVNEKGKEATASNIVTGAGGAVGNGAPWFLMDTTRAVKPIIRQKRKNFEFVAKTNPNTSDEVFMKKKFLYGVDGRSNVGYGFWQFCVGSKQPLSKDTFRAARDLLLNLKGDHGRPLGIMPNLLVVGTSNGNAARDILLADRLASGATNTDYKLVDLLQTPWLA